MNNDSFNFALEDYPRKLAARPDSGTVEKEDLEFVLTKLLLKEDGWRIYLTNGIGSSKTATRAKSVFAHL
jgi:hypothetical protein